mgnify:CR=1 FL=1
MPFTEDLSVFFNAAEFADAAVLDGAVHNGVFDNGYSEVYGMSTHDARFTCAETATTRAATTASVLIMPAGPARPLATTYRVRSVQPDGTGVCTLLLERQ